MFCKSETLFGSDLTPSTVNICPKNDNDVSRNLHFVGLSVRPFSDRRCKQFDRAFTGSPGS